MDWDALLELAWNQPVPVLVTLLVVVSGVVHVTVIAVELLTLFVEHLTGQLIGGRTAVRHLHAALVRLRGIFRREQPLPREPPQPQSTATKIFINRLRHHAPRRSPGRMRAASPFPAGERDRSAERYARDRAE